MCTLTRCPGGWKQSAGDPLYVCVCVFLTTCLIIFWSVRDYTKKIDFTISGVILFEGKHEIFNFVFDSL